MAFVISAGQVAKINRMPTYGPPIPTSVQISPNVWMTYDHIWRTQPALRTVTGFLARNVAQLGLHLFERVSDTNRKRISDHPFTKLMREPLPGTKWTHYRLINWTMHELAIYDDAYWIKGRVDDELALLPMPRRFIKPIGENPLYCDEYEISGSSGRVRTIKADQVVHFHGYNPLDMRIGVPPIETLRQILSEEMSASRYREQLWNNGARVQGFITRPLDAPEWGDVARSRFKADWDEQYSGGAALDGGGTPLLEDGMQFTGSGVTPKDAQYVEARKLTREEVATAYYIPPAMLGIMDGSGDKQLAELHQMFYQDALPPWLTQIEQDIENQLLPDVDAKRSMDGSLYVEFNINEKLRGSFESQAAALQSAVGGPWMLRSEARSRFNLPEIPETDELITPMNVTSGGLASPRDTAPNNPSNAESNGKPPGPKPVTTGR